MPLQWETSVNEALDYADRHWKNVVLVDWHGITERNPEVLVDGAHMKPEGARLYARADRQGRTGAGRGDLGGPRRPGVGQDVVAQTA